MVIDYKKKYMKYKNKYIQAIKMRGGAGDEGIHDMEGWMMAMDVERKKQHQELEAKLVEFVEVEKAYINNIENDITDELYANSENYIDILSDKLTYNRDHLQMNEGSYWISPYKQRKSIEKVVKKLDAKFIEPGIAGTPMTEIYTNLKKQLGIVLTELNQIGKRRMRPSKQGRVRSFQ